MGLAINGPRFAQVRVATYFREIIKMTDINTRLIQNVYSLYDLVAMSCGKYASRKHIFRL